ncbi:MAG: response regulator [Proteobacteria bacterium]|nr:response regulator [Pseudomonadota bacterium]
MSRILILEDDAALRQTLARAFSRRGHSVVEAADLTGLAGALEAPPKIEWAVLDLGLPDGSGLTAIETLKEATPDIRIAVLTGYGSISSAVEAMRRGATDYLTKPADVDQILAVLEGTTVNAEGAEHNPASLQRVEWEHIQRVLRDSGGNVTRAAEKLGVHRRTLQRKLSYRPPAE